MIPCFRQAISLARFDWVNLFQNISTPKIGGFAFILGGLLGFIGLVVKVREPTSRIVDRLAPACFLYYMFVLVLADPLLSVCDSSQVPVAVAWLAPISVGAVFFPFRGDWFTAVGCWAVLYSGMTVVSYNLSHTTSGMGFLHLWVY